MYLIHTLTRSALMLLGACTVLATNSAAAVSFKVMHTFDGSDGGHTEATLTLGSNGKLYGTSLYNGAYDGGTAFRVTPNGHVTLLHSFDGGLEGARPLDTVQGSDGNFYGATWLGGQYGAGNTYRMTPHGTVKELHSFQQDGVDCAVPFSGMIDGRDGHFYGTTYFGGAFGLGCVFKMTPKGKLIVLHSFNNDGVDGYAPFGRLALGSDGAIYGTTMKGGKHDAGTVFRLHPNGRLRVLHSFNQKGRSEGSGPASLVEGADGQFYGLATAGGDTGSGTVFRVTPTGDLTVLHHFDGLVDGAQPYGDFVKGRDGNFYGVASVGGAHDGGTAYQVTPEGGFTLLHAFDAAGPEGYLPISGLLEVADGEFYSTTYSGGAANNGTLFRISIK